MKYQTKTILTDGDPAGNLTSETLDIRNNYGVYVQAILTGAPTGDIVLQGSNDETNWSEITKVTISGSLHAINQDAIYAPYIRVYKAAGGTGTVTIKATIKGA
jgi:hypothetical protein